MIEEFNKYVSEYDINNANIKLKYNHSFRVMEQSENIAKSLGLSELDIKLAKLIGLLHDFGRFEQLKVYNTFDDNKSIDHADYAVDILFNKSEIKKYISIRDYDNIIKSSIQNHNKFLIENNLNEQELMHVKIIRDADKIDILNIFANKKEKSIIDVTEDLSDEVIKQINNKKSVKNEDIKNNNDRILSHFAFIYDINYKYSIKYIIDNKLIDRIYDELNNKERFKIYFDTVKKYMTDFLKEDN